MGNSDDGTAGQPTSEGAIILQLTDQYGAPVPNVPVNWSVLDGGGSLQFADAETDVYGLAGAEPILGSVPGPNDFFAIAGGLSADFSATGIAQPTILAQRSRRRRLFRLRQGSGAGLLYRTFRQQPRARPSKRRPR